MCMIGVNPHREALCDEGAARAWLRHAGARLEHELVPLVEAEVEGVGVVVVPAAQIYIYLDPYIYLYLSI